MFNLKMAQKPQWTTCSVDSVSDGDIIGIAADFDREQLSFLLIMSQTQRDISSFVVGKFLFWVRISGSDNLVHLILAKELWLALRQQKCRARQTSRQLLRQGGFSPCVRKTCPTLQSLMARRILIPPCTLGIHQLNQLHLWIFHQIDM